MKTILKAGLFLAVMLLSIGSSAQFYPAVPFTMKGVNTFSIGVNSDTLTVNATGSFKSASIQAVITGSVVGYAKIEGSIDGTNFTSIVASSSTLAITGSGNTNTKVWTIDYSPYEYYRLIAIDTTIVTRGAGTSTLNGYFLGAKNYSNTPNVVRNMTLSTATTATVTNTGTNYVGIKLNSWYETVSIQAVCTKVSGTQAGTVTLQGSIDGINYTTVNTGYLINETGAGPFTTGGAATLTATNVAVSTKIFVLRGSPYLYYRLSWTGSGTMVSKLQGFVLYH